MLKLHSRRFRQYDVHIRVFLSSVTRRNHSCSLQKNNYFPMSEIEPIVLHQVLLNVSKWKLPEGAPYQIYVSSHKPGLFPHRD